MLRRRIVITKIIPFLYFAINLQCHPVLSFLLRTSKSSRNCNQENLSAAFTFLHETHKAKVTPWCSSSILPKRRWALAGKSACTSLRMALVPLSVDDLEDILVITGTPTVAQYSTYWGRTPRERYSRFVEAATVSFLGVFFSYFLSFVLGSFVATISGSLFLFYSVLAPQWKAYQRNWEFRGGRNFIDVDDVDMGYYTDSGVDASSNRANSDGLYGALFLGRVAKVAVVEDAYESTIEDEFDIEDFIDYSMETDELEQWTGNPYLLRVQTVDNEGRVLQVHTRMSEEYLDLEPNQPLIGVLLSTSPSFTKLAGLTDVYVPDAECWIGDYPYLDRVEVERLLQQDDYIWDLLQSQRLPLRSRPPPVPNSGSTSSSSYDTDYDDARNNISELDGDTSSTNTSDS